jgi:hypothetical protein
MQQQRRRWGSPQQPPGTAHPRNRERMLGWAQIPIPCLLLAFGLRDYEIKLDRRINEARESLQLFLFAN